MHDPKAKLGPQMWDRPMHQSGQQCGSCLHNPIRAERVRQLRVLAVSSGPAPGKYLVCSRCDRVPWPGQPN